MIFTNSPGCTDSGPSMIHPLGAELVGAEERGGQQERQASVRRLSGAWAKVANDSVCLKTSSGDSGRDRAALVGACT